MLIGLHHAVSVDDLLVFLTAHHGVMMVMTAKINHGCRVHILIVTSAVLQVELLVLILIESDACCSREADHASARLKLMIVMKHNMLVVVVVVVATGCIVHVHGLLGVHAQLRVVAAASGHV